MTHPSDNKAALIALEAMRVDIAAVTAILVNAGDEPLTDDQKTRLAELNQQFESHTGGLPDVSPAD